MLDLAHAPRKRLQTRTLRGSAALALGCELYNSLTRCFEVEHCRIEQTFSSNGPARSLSVPSKVLCFSRYFVILHVILMVGLILDKWIPVSVGNLHRRRATVRYPLSGDRCICHALVARHFFHHLPRNAPVRSLVCCFTPSCLHFFPFLYYGVLGLSLSPLE